MDVGVEFLGSFRVVRVVCVVSDKSFKFGIRELGGNVL